MIAIPDESITIVRQIRRWDPSFGADAINRDYPVQQRVRAEPIGASDIWPLKAVNASTSLLKRVRIYYGTVSSIIPSGMTMGDAIPCYVSVVGSTMIFARISLDYAEAENEWEPSAVEFITSGSTPTPSEQYGYIQIASVAFSGGQISNVAPNVTGSQLFFRRGNHTDYTDYHRTA